MFLDKINRGMFMATQILETKKQSIVSINGAYYVLVGKNAKIHHSKRLGENLDNKKHQAVVEVILEEDIYYSRISFEKKPEPIVVAPEASKTVEPKSAVEAIEQEMNPKKESIEA
jgi:Fe-S cluster assembly scaffold protein SufB